MRSAIHSDTTIDSDDLQDILRSKDTQGSTLNTGHMSGDNAGNNRRNGGDDTANISSTKGLAGNTSANAHNGTLPTINTKLEHPPLPHRIPSNHVSAASLGLHLDTDFDTRPAQPRTSFETPTKAASLMSPPDGQSGTGSSLGRHLSTTSVPSPGSALASPFLAAMTDLTPLPSPLAGSPSTFGRSRDDDGTPSKTTSLPASPTSPPKKQKAYGSLVPAAVEASRANATAAQEIAKSNEASHGRDRSVSDFVPEPLSNIRQRHVTFGPGDNGKLETAEYHMQREAFLAGQRGMTAPISGAHATKAMPSPPPSNTSVASSADAADDDNEDASTAGLPSSEYLEIRDKLGERRRNYRKIRELGQGTFSKVLLGTTERTHPSMTANCEASLDTSKLVAIKIVEHGPAGGADEERVETSLKREIDILKSISHPSLVQLKSHELFPTRACLVLTYCPGGDLFSLASEHHELLTPPLVQRIFAELVSAVAYLHSQWIVHRDIKLENVLVNLPSAALANIPDPTTHPSPLITLTDLGLSKRIPPPPQSPLLTTRCGSEDYAAPELLLGQPYDGRLTDAWACGVLLYALMEGRLPFDAPPGKPDRSKKTHRIARCDWIWTKFGDHWGDWDEGKDESGVWAEGRQCVEGLLKKAGRGRMTVEEVGGREWVRGAVRVEDGLLGRSVAGDEGSG